MKLQYYVRGLAVGVLLTTIVLTIANAGKKPLTDAQIRQRALALGMIEIDSVRLSALQGENTSPPESGSESNTPESGTSAETAQSPEKEDNSTEASTQPETSPEQDVPMEQDVPLGSDAEPVTFQVNSGAGSSSV
ncbi:MAG: hypothetical protein K2O57_08470, partial [Acetatifactor sp.]|nr:hypothetical protein [Acetatifactor sp.]